MGWCWVESGTLAFGEDVMRKRERKTGLSTCIKLHLHASYMALEGNQYFFGSLYMSFISLDMWIQDSVTNQLPWDPENPENHPPLPTRVHMALCHPRDAQISLCCHSGWQNITKILHLEIYSTAASFFRTVNTNEMKDCEMEGRSNFKLVLVFIVEIWVTIEHLPKPWKEREHQSKFKF